MKSNISEPSNKKQKKNVIQQKKSDENKKEKKLNSINNKENSQSNQKQRKDNELNNSTNLKSQKNNEKIHKNKPRIKSPKNEQHKIFSASQEKDWTNNKNNSPTKTNKKNKLRNLSMDKSLKINQGNNNLKSQNEPKTVINSAKKKSQNNKKSKKEEEIINPLIETNYDPNLYGFNLYRHIKENLRNKDKLCKDKLTKESYYCIDCKISTCKKCLLFHVHNGHVLIPKYLYYESDKKIFNETFNEIDSLFIENPDYLDNHRLKEELKKIVTDNINKITKRLN